MNSNRGLFVSLGAHATLIILMIIKVSFFTKPELNLSEAIRVDMVGLPEKYVAASAQPEPAPKPDAMPEKIEPKIEPKAEPKVVENDLVNINKSKLKQKAALEKLKKLSAIDKIKQLVEKDNQKETREANKPIKGRVISKGTSLTGLDRIQSDNYLLQLDSLIKNHWQLPQWLIGKPLKTKILVKFSPNGDLLDKKVFQSSGNPTYDEYCLQAIEKSSPFPKVPEKFTEVYKEDGVLIGFPE